MIPQSKINSCEAKKFHFIIIRTYLIQSLLSYFILVNLILFHFLDFSCLLSCNCCFPLCKHVVKVLIKKWFTIIIIISTNKITAHVHNRL